MFKLFRKKSQEPELPAAIEASATRSAPAAPATASGPSWVQKLKSGLSRTSSNLSTLFTGTKIDDALYEELESALLMADTGVTATTQLLQALKVRVKQDKLTDAAEVKTALRELMIALLKPLEKPLELNREQPLVLMIAGVNGAGKTTTLGKLAKHMQRHDQKVLLAAGDTFRAAAREQLMIWGERNEVAVITQESGDPGIRRSGSDCFRRGASGPCARYRRGDDRYRRSAADAVAPDG